MVNSRTGELMAGITILKSEIKSKTYFWRMSVDA